MTMDVYRRHTQNPVYSDTTQLDVELSSVELRRLGVGTPSTTHADDRRRLSAVLKISEFHYATDPVELHAADQC